MDVAVFWSGAGAAVVGAIVAPLITDRLQQRSRRLASLRAVRGEIRANLVSLYADRDAAAPETDGSLPILFSTHQTVRAAIGADLATWQEETISHTLNFYGAVDLLERLIRDHEAIQLAPPPTDSLGLARFVEVGRVSSRRKRVLQVRDLAIKYGEAALGWVGREIAAVENFEAGS